MKPYHGIYLYSDLDGTLLQDDKTVSDENYAALTRFLDGGGSFGIATGRPLPTLPASVTGCPSQPPAYSAMARQSMISPGSSICICFPWIKRWPVRPSVRWKRFCPMSACRFLPNTRSIWSIPIQRDDLYIIWDNLPAGTCAAGAGGGAFWKILFCHRGEILDEAVPKLHLAPELITYRSEETYFEVLAQAKGGALAGLAAQSARV